MLKNGVLLKYKDLLPVTADTPLFSLGEGDTPLVRSRRLEKEIGWNEDNVEMAENYLETLQAIEKHIEEEMSWNEDDVKHAREYLVSLKEIKDND